MNRCALDRASARREEEYSDRTCGQTDCTILAASGEDTALPSARPSYCLRPDSPPPCSGNPRCAQGGPFLFSSCRITSEDSSGLGRSLSANGSAAGQGTTTI